MNLDMNPQPNDSAFDLSALYYAGRYEEALNGYTERAKQGCVDAQTFVAWMHEKGVGTPVDLGQARRWYEMALSSSPAVAHCGLARISSLEGDAIGAIRNLEFAAKENYAPALHRLGLTYDFGLGVERDAERALEYFEKAAALDNVYARKAVALRMIKGRRGLLRIPAGVVAMIKCLISGTRVIVANPRDVRLRTQ